MKKALFFIFLTCVIGCENSSQSKETPKERNIVQVPLINYGVVNIFPHDTALFTEGFFYKDGKIYESTGLKGKSGFLIYDLATGKVAKRVQIPSKYFGEGIAFLKNKFYQLTWLDHIGFIYDAKSFKQIGTFNYPSEGWALTTDGNSLIMNDGSNHITYLNAANLKPVKVLNVAENGIPQDSLNELEFIKGYIYANIWYRNEIVKIDTSNGNIVGKLDLTSIVNEAGMKYPGADVLNGIAYDRASDRIYVTGKLWQNIYQISFPH
ncbi:MAG TPA: glutaminyl-peptide cyclotransferase [Arachidicoccus sp.]